VAYDRSDKIKKIIDFGWPWWSVL